MTKIKAEHLARLKTTLARSPDVSLAIVFGSLACGQETIDSDVDVAVMSKSSLTFDLKIQITEALALEMNRPVDLVDLHTVGQPLLHEILSSGQQIIGTREMWGDLMYRNIMENEDFVPYQQRILEGRRKAWIDS